MANGDRNDDDSDAIRGYASPACLMHEIDPAYMGLVATPASRERPDATQRRPSGRTRLVVVRIGRVIGGAWRFVGGRRKAAMGP